MCRAFEFDAWRLDIRKLSPVCAALVLAGCGRDDRLASSITRTSTQVTES